MLGSGFERLRWSPGATINTINSKLYVSKEPYVKVLILPWYWQGRKRKKEAFLTDAEKEALQNYAMMKAARVGHKPR